MRVEMKKLAEMTSLEWNRIVIERIKVFVVQRFRPYQEIDKLDQKATHLLLEETNGDIVGYARIWRQDPQTVSFDRLLVDESRRGEKLGSHLLELVMKATRQLYPGTPIEIQAYDYLQPFFAMAGFHSVGQAKNGVIKMIHK